MVSALIAVSATPSGFELQGEPPPNMIDMMTAVQQGDLAHASELQLRIWIDGMYRQPDQVNPVVRQRAAEMNRITLANGTWGAADANPLTPLNPPAVKRLIEIRVPTLIIAGKLDHPELLRAADVMAAQIKDSKKVLIPDCAHVPNMEKPAEFNRAVLDFLRGLALS
jgi:2-hydroxy-6-oxonona-2,4-dienedioate hydrolase